NLSRHCRSCDSLPLRPRGFLFQYCAGGAGQSSRDLPMRRFALPPSSWPLPPPAFSERGHRGVAARLTAMRRPAVFVRAKGQRPHPRRSDWSCMDLEDAADNFTARKHVEIVLVPVAGRATCRCTFEDEVVLLHPGTILPSGLLSGTD